jgi:hypothetical protein
MHILLIQVTFHVYQGLKIKSLYSIELGLWFLD